MGEPIELPWWVFLCALPPVLVIAGAVTGPGPAAARLLGVIISGAMLAVLVAVARRVESRNMQSVWISAAYAVWFFAAAIWLVAAVGG
ncbi:MAG: hypothetical protein ABR564_08860 [Candidatus Dormibacteria bacterium]